ncbi:hypothetical protein JCM3770_003683 [Rhodotorula araucariae]
MATPSDGALGAVCSPLTDPDTRHKPADAPATALAAAPAASPVASPEVDDQDALFFAARRRERSPDLASGSPDRTGDPTSTGTRRARQRPASLDVSTSAWAGQLSQLSFVPRKSTTPDASVAHSATPPGTAAGAGSRDPLGARPHAPTAPARSRSSSADGAVTSAKGPPARRQRSFPAPSFRHSMRLAFLPSIPASPLPPILSPGLTRSASSPPVLPDIATGGPFSPSFSVAPLPATPALAASWPTAVDGALAPSPTASKSPYRTSVSAPDLSVVATAPVSEPSSYFSTPVATAASSPTSATVPLPLAGALGLTCHDDSQLGSELVIDTPIVAAEPKERAEAAQLGERQYHALVELVETERGYLEHLRVLVKVYFQTLPFLTALTVAEVHAVVRNAEQLLALHERIGERIDQVERELLWRNEGEGGEEPKSEEDLAARAITAAGRVARIFSDEMPSFDLYNDFCARHAEALDITRSIASRQEWEAFERQCAARVASDVGRGDRTPVAPAGSSQYFPSVSAPPTSNSPLPFSATPLTTPSHSSGTIPTQSSLAASAASSVAASTTRSRLRFADFAIAPVQRITRYPLVFGQLAKYFAGTPEHDALDSAWAGFKGVAQGVDAAKRSREGEMRTRVVARRMELHTPLAGGTFCDVLGPTLLVGALHVVHVSGSAPPTPATGGGAGGAGESLKVKYLGCFLYRSHLVMAKIKKRASYEPREWLPLRLFDIQGVDDGHGLLPHSIRLTFRGHQFELGALCAGERAVWLSHLVDAQSDARRAWDAQDGGETGSSTLFEDSVLSSVPTGGAIPPRKAHSRSASSISVASTFGWSTGGHGPVSLNSPVLAQGEPMPTIPSEFVDIVKATAPAASSAALSTSAPLAHISSTPSTSTHAVATTPTLASRSRFSSTVSSLLLGRTTVSQRTAVDLRLADVFSQECLAARAQAAREVEFELETAAGRRFRTMSGPKRSMTALAPAAAAAMSPPFAYKMLPGPVGSSSSMHGRRRMSSIEIGLGVADRTELRGAIGFDAAQAALYHNGNAKMLALGLTGVAGVPDKERGRGWASAIRHKAAGSVSVSSTSVTRMRPALPEIDTALAEHVARAGVSAPAKRGSVPPLSAGGNWSRRGRDRDRDRDGGLGGQLRRVASHGSVNATPTLLQTPLPTMPVLPNTLIDPLQSATGSRPASGVINNGAADVERNNSVSSTASSCGTGTHSSSSHAHSLQVLDTPPSSIPPSPDFGTVELAEALLPAPHAASPSAPAQSMVPHGAPSSPRWSTVSEGVSSVFRIRRRKSTLGLVPPAFPARCSPSTSDENLTSRSPTLHPAESISSLPHAVPASAAVKLQRRASTTISGLFSGKKRAQSSPALAGPGGYFGEALNVSVPHLALSRSPSRSTGSSGLNSPSQLPTTPEAAVALELGPPPAVSSSSASSSSTDVSSAQKRPLKEKAGVSGNKGPLLLRTRTRFLFASHNGMTPMS